MGAALRAKGELKAAIKSYDRAIEINPKHVGARYNKSMLLLNLEDFKMGWPAHEYRWKKSKLDSSARDLKPTQMALGASG